MTHNLSEYFRHYYLPYHYVKVWGNIIFVVLQKSFTANRVICIWSTQILAEAVPSLNPWAGRRFCRPVLFLRVPCLKFYSYSSIWIRGCLSTRDCSGLRSDRRPARLAYRDRTFRRCHRPSVGAHARKNSGIRRATSEARSPWQCCVASCSSTWTRYPCRSA